MAGRARGKGQSQPELKQDLRFFFQNWFWQLLFLSKPPGHTTQALGDLKTNTQWRVGKTAASKERELPKVTQLIIN